MKELRWLMLFVLSLTGAGFQSQTAPKQESKLENVEWTWAERSALTTPSLPNILLVGDSITRAYFPEVAKLLSGKANVYLFATSVSAGDPRLSKQLHEYFAMESLSFAVVHFNNGMHGWGYSETEYSVGLLGMTQVLQQEAPKSQLIWASITPVHKSDDSGANNDRIDARNAAALALMRKLSIQVDDQHLLMSSHDDLHSDNVHYSEQGSELQGKQVASLVKSLVVEGNR